MAYPQHNKHHLRRWPASYYFPQGSGTKWLSPRWTQGTLYVDYHGITFYQKSDRETPLRTIPFTAISGLKRASSTIIFSALVISVVDSSVPEEEKDIDTSGLNNPRSPTSRSPSSGQQHWFSSLPNRDAAYVIIEHFWRERLISPTNKKTRLGSLSSQRTKLGTDLLKMAEDSESTLHAAGTMLQRQGEQLDYAMGVMYDLNNDLDVAEKFISGFEGWVGHWRLPRSTFTNEPIEIIDSKTVPTVYDFPVLYAAWAEGAGSALKNGTLRISRDGMTIMDHEQINVYHYQLRSVSAIRVVSPWEMTISKYLIGQADISYLLMSTHMVHILRALEPLYKDKMDLIEPPPGMEPVCVPESPTASGSLDNDCESPSPPVQPLQIDMDLYLPQRKTPLHTSSHQIQTQITEQQPPEVVMSEVVSQAEADELRDMVARMKSMAVDISNEQSSQFEKIDALTGTVDRATDRLKADTSRVKLLLK